MLLAFGVVMAALLAACGGGPSTAKAAATATAPPSSTTPSTAAGANGFAAYTQCMAAHGVTSLGGRGNASPSSTAASATTVDPATMTAARNACASLRPAGGTGGTGGFGGGLNGPAAAAYRTCLQQHGVTLPTTGTAGGGAAGGGGGFSGAANQNNPAFQAAAQACASLRPVRPATSTT